MPIKLSKLKKVINEIPDEYDNAYFFLEHDHEIFELNLDLDFGAVDARGEDTITILVEFVKGLNLGIEQL